MTPLVINPEGTVQTVPLIQAIQMIEERYPHPTNIHRVYQRSNPTRKRTQRYEANKRYLERIRADPVKHAEYKERERKRYRERRERAKEARNG
jgi:hypothetical protein